MIVEWDPEKVLDEQVDDDLRPEYDLAELKGGVRGAPDAEELAGIYGLIARAIPCPAAAFWGRR